MVKSCVNNTLRWTVGCCAIAETVIATAESVKSPNTLAALTIGFFINASLIHQWIEGLSDTLPIGRSMGDCAARRHATLLPSTRPRLRARRLESVIDPGDDLLNGEVDAHGQRRPLRYVQNHVPGLKIGEVVFEPHRPIGIDRVFDTAADRPSDLGRRAGVRQVAHVNYGRPRAGEGGPSLGINQKLVESVPHTAGDERKPTGAEARSVGRRFEAGPGKIRLGAEEQGVPHPIHAKLAATENSGRLQAVA